MADLPTFRANQKLGDLSASNLQYLSDEVRRLRLDLNAIKRTPTDPRIPQRTTVLITQAASETDTYLRVRRVRYEFPILPEECNPACHYFVEPEIERAYPDFGVEKLSDYDDDVWDGSTLDETTPFLHARWQDGVWLLEKPSGTGTDPIFGAVLSTLGTNGILIQVLDEDADGNIVPHAGYPEPLPVALYPGYVSAIFADYALGGRNVIGDPRAVYVVCFKWKGEWRAFQLLPMETGPAPIGAGGACVVTDG